MKMKKTVTLIIFCLLSSFVLPVCVFYVRGGNTQSNHNTEQLHMSEEINVFFHNENKTISMPIEEYLCGVVCAEMPAEFEYEALKAQAVAARSYARYKQNETNAVHPDAAVCTDYTHCKAYKTFEENSAIWGADSANYRAKIENAILETRGEVITYNGEVALAVFHSQSGGGRTENSKDVWGGSVPYLVSVESHGEENSPGFYSDVTVPFEDFKKTIAGLNPSAVLTSPDNIGQIEKSEGGAVKTIQIGGQQFTGKEIRAAFGLRSSCFRINTEGDNIRFEVTGYGHGVGMSQYGANTMAKEGSNYKEILKHYYSGIEIEYV